MERQNKRQVQMIRPRAITRLATADDLPVVRKKVAAYARVSTDHEEQQTSYEAQVDYYTQKIQSNLEWELVEVYTDKGITGTNTKKRDGFNRMIKDALAGKIELILTKSVSRFARNTVDTLTTIRKLKEHGVAVYFEEQSINTMDGKGELLITIMSSIAQEESRSISDNVTWGKRKSASDGKISIGYKHFLGYVKGEDGFPRVIEEQAKIVRYIYRSFMMGKTATYIAQALTDAGVPSPGSKKVWQESTIMSILQNEKYKGAALLQKRFTVDFLEKRMKVNEGEVPQYYIEHSHEAIIDPVEHDRVQLEISRRKAMDRRYCSAHTFSSRVICGDCGGFYGRKVWHSTDLYKRIIWRCNEKYRKEQRCATPHLTEDELKACFVDAYNQRAACRTETLTDCQTRLNSISDMTEIDAEISRRSAEIESLIDQSKRLIEENTRSAHDQEEYQMKHAALVAQYNQACERLAYLQNERSSRMDRQKSIEWFMESFSRREELLEEFDEELFFSVLDSMIVHTDGSVAVRFRDGIDVAVERNKSRI